MFSGLQKRRSVLTVFSRAWRRLHFLLRVIAIVQRDIVVLILSSTEERSKRVLEITQAKIVSLG